MNLTFSEALAHLKTGGGVPRKGWNGKDMVVRAQFPNKHSKMTQPYLYIEYPKNEKYPNGCLNPWLASQGDLMDEDWFIVD